MDKGKKSLQMAIRTKENSKTVGSMDLEYTNGQMGLPSMKVHSRMDSDMVRANGLRTKLNTSAIMCRDSKRVMENFISQVAIFTRGTLSTIGGKDMAKCSGQMGHFTRVSGKMGLRMVRDKFICQAIKS